MEIGERAICLCLVSLLLYSARVAGVQLKVVVFFMKHKRTRITEHKQSK